MRRIVNLSVSGSTLMGTHHCPDLPSSGRVGFLFLNAGPAPRAGNSDLYAYLGDHLAHLGFDAFRFDFPGLGDSPGALPVEVQAYWVEVQRGRNVDVTVNLARQLREHFKLEGLVAGGVCAGAVTGLFAAERAPDLIGGLVLLEPNLLAPFAERFRKSLSSGYWRWPKRGYDWNWMSGRFFRFLTRDHSLARRLKPLLPIFLRVGTLLGGPSAEVNRPLVEAWRRVLSGRAPTFLLVVDGEIQHHLSNCILSTVPKGERKAITELKIQETNHILTRGSGRELVLQAVGHWASMKKTLLLGGQGPTESDFPASHPSRGRQGSPGASLSSFGGKEVTPGERHPLGAPRP